MARRCLAVILVVTAATFAGPCRANTAQPPRPGAWRAWLESPGGELPFGLELAVDPAVPPATEGVWQAVLVNDPERIAVPVVKLDGDRLTLAIGHYDASIEAVVSAGGTRLQGEYRKRRGQDTVTRMPFRADFGAAARFAAAAAPAPARELSGRWRVQFASSEDPAVGSFVAGADGAVHGTFLTATGDYRFLAGCYDAPEPGQARLRLSCFDGAHAFLFEARRQDDGSLRGDFWSGDAWHEAWTAVRDANAALADGFAQSRVPQGVVDGAIAFPDLDGVPRRLDSFAGKARALLVFGTWCPNCHDATAALVELHRDYAAAGLSIVGLACELTDDTARNARQAKAYAARLGVPWPILLAGPADKAKATKALGMLDRIRAYPTLILLHADGRQRAVYTGFVGPAAGVEHERLLGELRAVVQELLETG